MLFASALMIASAEDAKPAGSKPTGQAVVRTTKAVTEGGSRSDSNTGTAKSASVAASKPPMMEGRDMPTTGEKALDQQIMALRKEMDEKINAIRMEYESKLKTLVGDKKLMWATSTQKTEEPSMLNGPGSARWATSTDMKKKMENGSGTPMRENVNDTQSPKIMPGGVKTGDKKMVLPSKPVGMIKDFFQSIFGSPADAQAETQ